MRRFVFILVGLIVMLTSCKYKPFEFTSDEGQQFKICRYDRLESQYLTTSDFSALQQMNTDYPMETRALIEDMLKLGDVNDPLINKKFLSFYQDSTLQLLISDAESQYANMDDLNSSFAKVFENIEKYIPGLPVPKVYTQIGALDQSIIVGDNTIGISLDKYLGVNYPLYLKYYPMSQRVTMTREYIVPDAICFYVMSHYPMKNFDGRPQLERDLHVAKFMYLCNLVLEKKFFHTKYVDAVGCYLRNNPSVTIAQLIKDDDYKALAKFAEKPCK